MYTNFHSEWERVFTIIVDLDAWNRLRSSLQVRPTELGVAGPCVFLLFVWNFNPNVNGVLIFFPSERFFSIRIPMKSTEYSGMFTSFGLFPGFLCFFCYIEFGRGVEVVSLL